MKSVLLHIRDDLGFESRFQAACDLARATEGHIHCAQVTMLPDFLAADMYGGAALAPSLIADLREVDDKMQARVEEKLVREGVRWSWRQSDGDALRGLLAAATLSDLIVVTLPDGPREGLNDPLELAANLALGGRTPVLAVPQAARSMQVAGRALVAWDGSQESSAALRLATPLLRLAEDVHVVTVEEAGKYPFPATDACEYLALHGIRPQLHNLPRHDHAVEDVLEQATHDLGPDWMVMGAYGHSRMRQFMFGGVTRTMLRNARVPLLLAH